MNIVSDNNLSFQAKIVTPLNGRNNSMAKLKNAFEKISNKVDGELVIERYPHVYNKIFATVGDSSMYVGEELHKFLSLENPTKAEIKDAANKALNTLKTLQAEEIYNKKAEQINSTIGNDIRRCEREKAKALVYHNNTLAEILQKNINKLSVTRDEKMKKIQETFVKKLDLYAPKSLDAKYGEYTKYDLKMNQ